MNICRWDSMGISRWRLTELTENCYFYNIIVIVWNLRSLRDLEIANVLCPRPVHEDAVNIIHCTVLCFVIPSHLTSIALHQCTVVTYGFAAIHFVFWKSCLDSECWRSLVDNYFYCERQITPDHSPEPQWQRMEMLNWLGCCNLKHNFCFETIFPEFQIDLLKVFVSLLEWCIFARHFGSLFMVTE